MLWLQMAYRQPADDLHKSHQVRPAVSAIQVQTAKLREYDQRIRQFFLPCPVSISATILFIIAIWIVVWRDPGKAPAGTTKEPLSVRLRSLARAGWIIGIIVMTIGSIYTGVFSAVKAAGIGACLALLVTIFRKQTN